MAYSKVSQSPQYSPPQVKLEGVTSYKSQFVEPPKVSSRPPPPQTYQRVQVPFNGSSSYKNDYPEYKIQPRRDTLDDLTSSYRAPQVKFDGRTSYNDTFKGYALPSPDQMASSRVRCAVENLNVPPVNYLNDKNHIYYDPEMKKFV